MSTSILSSQPQLKWECSLFKLQTLTTTFQHLHIIAVCTRFSAVVSCSSGQYAWYGTWHSSGQWLAPCVWGVHLGYHVTGGSSQVTGQHCDHINTCSSDNPYQFKLQHHPDNIIPSHHDHGSHVWYGSRVRYTQHQSCRRGETEVFVASSLATWKIVSTGDHSRSHPLHQNVTNKTQDSSWILTSISKVYPCAYNKSH